jgi:hypothetical protein
LINAENERSKTTTTRNLRELTLLSFEITQEGSKI